MNHIRYSIVIICLLLPVMANSQSKNIRTQEKEIRKASGKEKVQIAKKYFRQHKNSNPSQAAKFAESGIKESESLGMHGSTIEFGNFLGAYFFRNNSSKAEKYTLSTIGAAQKINAAKQEERSYEFLVKIYSSKSGFAKKLALANLKLKTIRDRKTMASLNQSIKIREADIQEKEEKFQMENSELQSQIDSVKYALAQEEAQLAVMKLQKMEDENSIMKLEAIKQQQEHDLEKAAIQLRNQRIFNRLAIAGIVIVLLFAGIIYQNFRLIRLRSQERATSQQQLMMQEKMATLGQLTAGIAHEIKNPLNFVNNFSEGSIGLVEELEEQLNTIDDQNTSDAVTECQELAGELKENASSIMNHGQRIEKIVHSMMEHARGNTGEQQLVDLNNLIEENLTLAKAGYKGIHHDFDPVIKSDLDLSIGKAEVITQDLSRVFLNLFGNAFYALHQRQKEEGTVFVPTLSIHSQNNGNHAMIKIRDNGPGIPDTIIEKIFTPFFTTKPTGDGNTGLGLSISYDIIVQGHQGELKVDSQEGEFTEFAIKLPI